MVQEEGCFDFNDICVVISDKLECRYLYVFVDSFVENSSEVFVCWE